MNNEKRFYVVFFGTFVLVQEAFIGPVLVIFYTKYLGFSFPEMMLFFSIIMLSSSIFEIPCGILSDIYGRKLGFVFGEAIKMLSMTSLFFLNNTDSFQGAMIFLAILWGYGNAQSSGNLMPILHQMAGEAKIGEKFQKLLSYGHGVGYGVTFVASISAGYLAAIDLAIPIIIDIVLCAALILVCSTWLPNSGRPHDSSTSFTEAMKDIAGEARRLNYRALVPLSLMAGIFFGASRSAFNFLQPELQIAKISIEYWGWISSGIFLASSIAGNISGAINVDKMKAKNIALFFAGVMLVGLLVLFAFANAYSIISYLVLCGIVGVLLRPIIIVQLLALSHNNSRIKTTIFSIYALILSGCMAAIQTIFGMASQTYSNSHMVLACSFLSVVSMLAFSMIRGAGSHEV